MENTIQKPSDQRPCKPQAPNARQAGGLPSCGGSCVRSTSSGQTNLLPLTSELSCERAKNMRRPPQIARQLQRSLACWRTKADTSAQSLTSQVTCAQRGVDERVPVLSSIGHAENLECRTDPALLIGRQHTGPALVQSHRGAVGSVEDGVADPALAVSRDEAGRGIQGKLR